MTAVLDLPADRFDAVLGPGRGIGGHLENRLGTDRPWTLYHAHSQARMPSGSILRESRPAHYRSRATAQRGADALRRRFPFYETDVRAPEPGEAHWRMYYRKLPGVR